MLVRKIFKELQLPVKFIERRKPNLGIGPTSAKDTATAVILASSHLASAMHLFFEGSLLCSPITVPAHLFESIVVV